MADLADIEHRFSFFAPGPKPRDHVLDSDGFYLRRAFPDHRAHGWRCFAMRRCTLARQAIAALDIAAERATITHLIVASCTGFTAPGTRFPHHAGRRPRAVGRAHHRRLHGLLRRGERAEARPPYRALGAATRRCWWSIWNFPACICRKQWELEKMLSFLLFGDGCGACLVSAEPVGLALDRFHADGDPAQRRSDHLAHRRSGI